MKLNVILIILHCVLYKNVSNNKIESIITNYNNLLTVINSINTNKERSGDKNKSSHMIKEKCNKICGGYFFPKSMENMNNNELNKFNNKKFNLEILNNKKQNKKNKRYKRELEDDINNNKIALVNEQHDKIENEISTNKINIEHIKHINNISKVVGKINTRKLNRSVIRIRKKRNTTIEKINKSMTNMTKFETRQLNKTTKRIRRKITKSKTNTVIRRRATRVSTTKKPRISEENNLLKNILKQIRMTNKTTLEPNTSELDYSNIIEDRIEENITPVNETHNMTFESAEQLFQYYLENMTEHINTQQPTLKRVRVSKTTPRDMDEYFNDPTSYPGYFDESLRKLNHDYMGRELSLTYSEVMAARAKDAKILKDALEIEAKGLYTSDPFDESMWKKGRIIRTSMKQTKRTTITTTVTTCDDDMFFDYVINQKKSRRKIGTLITKEPYEIFERLYGTMTTNAKRIQTGLATENNEIL